MEIQDVKNKVRRKNKILFSRDSKCLQDLLQLMAEQNHRTLVLWGFECAEKPAVWLKKRYPFDTRIDNAIVLSKQWARGEIKMPLAQRAILQLHAMAKEIDDQIDIALCHAIGHGCATVHTERHAIGLPMYELTAIVMRYGIDNCEPYLENRINEYISCLDNCSKNIEIKEYKWANFLLNDKRPNQEKAYLEKRIGTTEK